VAQGTYGTQTTFTAAGSSIGTLPAIAYSYRFWLDGAMVQTWSGTATYNMPATTLGGTHSVRVEVTTEATPATVEYSTTIPAYAVNYPAATSVSAVANPANGTTYGSQATFTATGASAVTLPTSAYSYRFSLTPSGGTATVVQNWSASNQYVLPTSTGIGSYTVRVDVSTAVTPSTAQGISWSGAYTISGAVSFVSILPASPQVYGTPVTFTAAASGPAGVVFQYRFTLDAGTPGAWSLNNSYVLPQTTLAGSHTVTVEASSAAVPTTAQATATTGAYVIVYPVATGVTLASNVPSPQTVGATVTFKASGSSTLNLPPSAYQYRFYLMTNYGAWVQVQDYGVSDTYQLDTSVAANYNVLAWVRTDPASVLEASSGPSPLMGIQGAVTAATAVTVTTLPVSPSPIGTPITWQATGVGSTTGGVPTPQTGYQFLFYLSSNGGPWVQMQDYGIGSQYSFTPTQAGYYQVNVWVRTNPSVPYDANGLSSQSRVQ
jgi:hypothetical protein